MFYLGTITTGATGTTAGLLNSQNNYASGASFGIPPSTKAIYLQADQNGMLWAMLGQSGLASPTGAANLPTGLQGPFSTRPSMQSPTVVAVVNPTGGTVRVRVFAGGF